VAGGLVGKGAAEAVNPTVEHEYWRKNYGSRSYVQPGETYDEYAPAYQYGWESRSRHSGKRFEDVEDDLRRNWDRAKGKSRLQWERAKQASRDAWERAGSERAE
jgi:hypothetical protein